MSDNLVLEHLHAIRSSVDRLSDDMQEVKGRFGTLETQYSSISNRLDRIDDRVHRIENHLDLVDV